MKVKEKFADCIENFIENIFDNTASQLLWGEPDVPKELFKNDSDED